MENSTQTNVKQAALKNGAIWAAINIVIFLVVWYALRSIIAETWYFFLSVAIGITFGVYFCKDLRTKAGGYWTFSQALWPIFGMFIFQAGIVYIFTIGFGKFVDTNYPVYMKEVTMEKSMEIYEKIGMDDAMLEETLAKQEESMEKQFNPNISQAIKGFGITAISYFVGALIFAAIFKKSDPNPWKDVIEEENQASV